MLLSCLLLVPTIEQAGLVAEVVAVPAEHGMGGSGVSVAGQRGKPWIWVHVSSTGLMTGRCDLKAKQPGTDANVRYEDPCYLLIQGAYSNHEKALQVDEGAQRRRKHQIIKCEPLTPWSLLSLRTEEQLRAQVTSRSRKKPRGDAPAPKNTAWPAPYFQPMSEF